MQKKLDRKSENELVNFYKWQHKCLRENNYFLIKETCCRENNIPTYL